MVERYTNLRIECYRKKSSTILNLSGPAILFLKYWGKGGGYIWISPNSALGRGKKFLKQKGFWIFFKEKA